MKIEMITRLLNFNPGLNNNVRFILYSFLLLTGITPFNIWPLALPALGLGLCLIFKSESGTIFWKRSLLFFGVHYFLSSYWIISPFSVVVNSDIAALFLGLFALLLVSLVMSFSMTLCLYVAWILKNKYRLGNLLSVSIISLFFVMGEILRSEFLGGYPMNFLGYMVGSNDYLIQLASIGSVFLVSLVLVFISQLMVGSFKDVKYALGCLLIIFLLGVFKIEVFNSSEERPYEIDVRLVNGNLTQHQLMENQNTPKVSDYYTELSLQERAKNPELIVWPESVLQYYIQETYNASNNLSHLRRFLDDEQVLITGGPSIEDYQSDETVKYFSSLFAIEGEGEAIRYDKHRLVPWGEYIPFRSLLPDSLANLFDIKDYTHGKGELSIKLKNGLNILPLLCAEGHFPQMLWQYQKDQNLVVMVGNEAWYENTIEADQYLVNAKFRAVESGLPVLLASNKGHLAVFDKNGRLIAHSYNLSEPTILDAKLIIEL